jgi:3-hydroxyacyl-CoA dehydrogenase
MASVGSTRIDDRIGVLTIESPPVNALGLAVRQALVAGLSTLLSDDGVDAVVIICAGRTFFAGADITEFGKPFQPPSLHDILDLIEASPKPIVAAIHGTALGGGLETALTCHYRIAVPSAKLGLPEVHLGILPGAGGTQRLPRVTGVEVALEMMTSGRPIGAAKALESGLVDALAEEGRLREDAIVFARKLVDERAPLAKIRDRDEKIAPARATPEVFQAFREKHARAFRGFKAPEAIIQAVEAAVTLPFDEGLKREVALFRQLEDSPESRAQRHYFFAERDTAKVPDIPADTPVIEVTSVAVIGAGTMGGGIAMNFLNIGVPVTLVETSQDALDRGIATIRHNYEATAAKGRMTAAQVEERMARITPALELEAAASADLIIEAVYESMAVKLEVFGKLDAIAKPGAILASNTSFLNIDEIAAATSRPDSVLGLHFFSPANVMRLLEVVRGEKTSKTVLATALRTARRIGKLPVVSRVCHGFIANRLMMPRLHQAEALVLEGPTPQAIDKAITDYGFAMGPFQMIDLVGLDVVERDDPRPNLRKKLVALGRLGQKQGGGFYDYDEKRRPTPSPVAAKVIEDFAGEKGVANTGPQDAATILATLMYPVVNEGAKILEEGIAARASDIDVAAILGYGWPVYTGGPMAWADEIGLDKVVAGLDALAARHGPAFAPAPLLKTLAEEGRYFTR